jgi:hypothetical protein
MMTETTNNLDDMIVWMMAVWLDCSIVEAVLYSLFIVKEMLDCMLLSKTAMQVYLVAEEFRVGVHDCERIELLLESFY